MQNSVRCIGIFCGSRAGARPEYLRTAAEIGEAIAERGGTLIYGAGGVGLMGAASDAAHQAGAKVIGVIPASLHERERLENACGEILVVENMHARKALMYKLADAFVVLPGGYGTMDELMEVTAWNQLGFHHRPLVLANVNGFFDPLLSMLDRMAIDGFIHQEERGLIRVETDPHGCLDVLGMPRTAKVISAVRTGDGRGSRSLTGFKSLAAHPGLPTELPVSHRLQFGRTVEHKSPSRPLWAEVWALGQAAIQRDQPDVAHETTDHDR
jgi:uncharacterized protein (TIGR00730 family)